MRPQLSRDSSAPGRSIFAVDITCGIVIGDLAWRKGLTLWDYSGDHGISCSSVAY